MNHNAEQPMEDRISGVPVLPACVDGSKRGPQDQVPNIIAPSVMPSVVQISSDQMTNPWCFSPLANQWLVPVLSQSDGLVYKPYSRHCPPLGGFMPPLYGGCNPLGVSPMSRDFINVVHAVPVSQQPPNMVLPGLPTMSSPYFPIPYHFPPSNPIITSSVVEQASNLSGSQVNGKTGQLSRGSHNMLYHPRKDAIVGNPRKFQLSKKSELQGSTASSPSEKVNPENRCPVPPLPAAPAVSRDRAKHALLRLCLTMLSLLPSQRQGFSNQFRKRGSSMTHDQFSNRVQLACQCQWLVKEALAQHMNLCIIL